MCYNEKVKGCEAKLFTCVVLNNDIAGKYTDRLGLSTKVIPTPKSFSNKEKAEELEMGLLVIAYDIPALEPMVKQRLLLIEEVLGEK